MRGFACLPGGVNALSRSFNERFCFKGNHHLIRAFLAKCSSYQVNIPLPITSLPPPVAICSFIPHSRIQIDLTDMAPEKNRNFMSNNRWGYWCLNCKVLLFKVLLVVSLGKQVSR